MMQFIITWFRIYNKFKSNESACKSWNTDEKEIKESGLYKLVEGATMKEKIINLTYGRRDDLATFQDQINYCTDYIARLIASIKVEPEKVVEEKASNKELLDRLNAQIAQLRDKIAFLDSEKKLLYNDKDMYGEFGNEGNSLEQNLKGLEAEKNALIKQEEDLKLKWTNKMKDIEGKNMDLMAEKDKVLSDFHEYKTREEANLQSYVQDMNAKLENLNDNINRQRGQNEHKANKIAETNKAIEQLNSLKADLEHDNSQIKKSNEILHAEIDKFNQGFHEDMNNLESNLNEHLNELNNCKTEQRAAENINSKLKDEIKYYETINQAKLKALENLSNDLKTKQNIMNELDKEINVANSNLKSALDEKNKVNELNINLKEK